MPTSNKFLPVSGKRLKEDAQNVGVRETATAARVAKDICFYSPRSGSTHKNNHERSLRSPISRTKQTPPNLNLLSSFLKQGQNEHALKINGTYYHTGLPSAQCSQHYSVLCMYSNGTEAENNRSYEVLHTDTQAHKPHGATPPLQTLCNLSMIGSPPATFTPRTTCDIVPEHGKTRPVQNEMTSSSTKPRAALPRPKTHDKRNGYLSS
jgi:hypothetical protein